MFKSKSQGLENRSEHPQLSNSSDFLELNESLSFDERKFTGCSTQIVQEDSQPTSQHHRASRPVSTASKPPAALTVTSKRIVPNVLRSRVLNCDVAKDDVSSSPKLLPFRTNPTESLNLNATLSPLTANFLSVGQKLGSFHCLQMIARGGNSVVYKMKKDEQMMVFKCAHRKLPLEHEASILQNLKSDFIVKTFGFYELETSYALCMPFYSNGSVHEYLLNNTLTVLEKTQMCLDGLEGLKFLHNAKVVHLDIKPNNLLVDHNTRVVITDFGSAKRLKVGEKVKGEFGTEWYWSYQQIMKEEYSYGPDKTAITITIIEIIYGKHIYLNRDSTHNIKKLVLDQLKTRDILKEIEMPVEWQETLLKSFRVEEDERPEIDELINLLKTNYMKTANVRWRTKKPIKLTEEAISRKKQRTLREYLLGNDTSLSFIHAQYKILHWCRKCSRCITPFLNPRFDKKIITVKVVRSESFSVRLETIDCGLLLIFGIMEKSYDKEEIMEDLMPLIRNSIILLVEHFLGISRSELEVLMSEAWK